MSPVYTASYAAYASAMPSVRRYIPDAHISTRKTAYTRGGQKGIACAKVFGTMGRTAARIAANDYVREHHVPERWRKVFTDAFIKAAIKVGR